MPKITKELVFRAASYLKPYRLLLAIIFVCIIITSVLNLFPSLITGAVIDQGFLGGNFMLVVRLIVLSLVVVLVSNLIGVLQSYVSNRMAQRIMYDMRNEMYRHLEFMSHRFFTNERQGDLITRMTSDIGGVNFVLSGTLTQIFSNLILIITTVIALFGKNWILALSGIAMIPLFILPTKVVGKKRFEIALQTQKKNDEVNQILNETLNVSGSLLVKLFNKEEREYEKYRKANDDITRLAIRESIVGRWFGMTIGVFTNIGPSIIYFVAALLYFVFGDSSITVGDITVMVALVSRLYGPINSLFNMQIDLTRSMALFHRIFTYFDMPHEIKNKDEPIVESEIKGDIVFNNVGFYYSEDKPILKGVSIEMPHGRTTAIVGPSGAGKSTIINLIPRLYDVISGSITVDGIDVRDWDMFLLRRNIGFVTQDTYLFNGSIKENLLYAKEDATEAEIIEACKKANIHEFIVKLPEGYDTLVGNRGLKLSGGEKQRVSIARVVLHNPKILLLDEATSSLDSISESLIQEAINPLLTGRTSVVIAHRLSTIMEADEIIVLAEGGVQGRGTHAELLASNAIYKELYETQFRKAIDAALA